MARLYASVLLFVAAFIGVNGRPIDAAQPLKVMTWNVHMGVDERGRYTLPRIADVIAAAGPSIVGVQEVSRNHAVYNCEDQPKLIADRLGEVTGRRWYHVYVKEWDTKKRQCVESGRGDEHETEGLALFAPEPLLEVEHGRLWNGRIVVAARLASAPGVTVMVTHLAHSARNVKDRVRQIDALLPWAAARKGARVLMGDLNAEADAPELRPVLSHYRDSWPEARRAGAARGVQSGSTRPGSESRIDYVLYTPDAGLALESVEVLNTAGESRSEASDHRPVLATFRVNATPAR